MKATLFRRITLLMVVAGVSLIYLATAVFTPSEVRPGSIENGDIGTFVHVSGEIVDPRTHDGTQFFTLDGPDGAVDAVAFTPDPDVADGMSATVTGRVNVYQGSLELVVEEVQPVSAENR